MLLGEELVDALKLQAYDLLDLFPVEAVEDDDLVDAVEELRPEAGLERVHHAVAHLGLVLLPGKLLDESREVFQKRKADLEGWFKERDIKMPTREELVAIAEKYKKGSDEEEAPPARGRRRRGGRRSPAPEESRRSRSDEASGAASGAASSSSPTSSSPTTSPRATTRAAAAPEGDPYVLGRREFDRAFGHWRKARPASADEQRELKTARKHFATARDHFERAKELHPDDAKLDELLTDCNRFLYDCMKRTILDLH